MTVSSRSVLLVEDETLLRNVVTRALRHAGHGVTAVDCAEAALSTTEHVLSSVEIVICDIVLPDQEGFVLAEKLLPLCPRAGFVFISGHPVRGAMVPELGRPTRFLRKPFTPQALERALTELEASR